MEVHAGKCEELCTWIGWQLQQPLECIWNHWRTLAKERKLQYSRWLRSVHIWIYDAPTVETGLILSGASAWAADCAALPSWQQEFTSTSHADAALGTAEPEDKPQGLWEGLERDYVALFPQETCLPPVHWEGAAGLFWLLMNNLKGFPQVPRSVKTITWDRSLNVWKISQLHKNKQENGSLP